MANYGVVEYFGCSDSSYPCGYCKQMKAEESDYGKCRFGMWAHSLSNSNYQNLIDRNWRRSGKYCYKPILNRSCCPMYTIRCDALNFKLKKSQKKVIKKFNRFVMKGEKTTKRQEREIQAMDVLEERMEAKPVLDEKNANKEYKMSLDSIHEAVGGHEETVCIDNKVVMNDNISCDQKTEDKPNVQKKSKAKAIRIERKLNKIMEKEKCDRNVAKDIMNENFKKKIIRNDKRKSIEDYLTEFDKSADNTHKLEIRFVSTNSDEYKETFEASHEVYRKYQMSIHKDSFDKCTQKQYKRFLIDSPLKIEKCETSDDLPNSLGSYHQQYWLNDKLIAVGVIDVLPKCVSSVYLYYDPDYDFLSLGTYSALREIYLVRRLQQFIPDLKHYYMGFYIHSCPKMKYKGQFMPSELLCGETFSWNSISKCVPKLDSTKYCRFDDNSEAIDSDGKDIKDTEIQILHKNTVMSFRQFKTCRVVNQKDLNEVNEFAKLVGRKCSPELLLYRT